MKEWILNHDDRWVFTIGYVSLAIILSLTISIFWLIVLVVIHAYIEWHALSLKGVTHKFSHVTWHIKLDIALIIFALMLGVYIDLLFGLLGLGAASRAGAQLSSRMLAWQTATRSILLSLDDAAQIAKAIGRKKDDRDIESEIEHMSGSPWKATWSFVDHAIIWLSAAMILLIAFAPMLTDHSYKDVVDILLSDLHPWP